MKLDIEIAIPVFNEEKDLEKQINKIQTYIKKKISGLSIGLVIADNGSTDNTIKIAKRLSKQKDIRNISVYKKGVGIALKTAWTSSKARYVGYMDLDTATDLKHLKEIAEIIISNNYAILSGSRHLSKSRVENRKIHREITSRGFNYLIRFLFNSKITDGMIGFKFLKKELLNELISNGANSDGWIFCTQILLVAEYLKIEIKELPVFWSDDHNSKVQILSLIYNYLKALIKLKIRFIFFK